MVCCVIGCPNHGSRNVRRGGNDKITYHMFPNPNHHRFRMQQWLDACNNPKIRQRDPLLVYKQFRMCRLHFAIDCFNGACKRLLETAVPTLNLRLNLEATKSPKRKDSQLRENEPNTCDKAKDQTIGITPPSLESIEYETEYLENATVLDQRFSSIDSEMKAIDDEDDDNEYELYEEDDLIKVEDGNKHDDLKESFRNYLYEILFSFTETIQAEITTAEEDAYLYEVIDVIDDADTPEMRENILPSKFT